MSLPPCHELPLLRLFHHLDPHHSLLAVALHSVLPALKELGPHSRTLAQQQFLQPQAPERVELHFCVVWHVWIL